MPAERWSVIGRFSLLFVFLSIAVVVVVFAFYRANLKGEKQLIERNQKDILDHMKDISVTDFGSVVSDLMFLSEHKHMREYLRDPSENNIKKLASDYLSLGIRKGVYDQIRFIDATGMEVVRVNYNEGDFIGMSLEKPQRRADRYYVKEILTLSKGEVFVSPLDLNVDNAEAERSYELIMRFGTPVFDNNGKLQGMVILNYLAEKFMNKLKDHENISYARLMLLNKNGYYLSGVEDRELWGFMEDKGRGNTFQTRFQEEWKMINERDRDQFYTPMGLFSYVTIYPVRNSLDTDAPVVKDVPSSKYAWKMVTFVPRDVFKGLVSKYSYILTAMLLIVFAGISLWYLAGCRLRKFYAEEALKKANLSLERKVAERTQKLNTLNEELEAETSRLAEFIKVVDKINKELIASNQYKTTFLSNISHEMKTPLNHIITSAELLHLQGCGRVTDECRKYVKNIKAGSNNLMEFIDDLLELTSAASGGIDMNMAEFKAKDILEEVVDKTISMTAAKHQDFKINIDKDLGLVRGEPGMLRQVFLNLLENAVKFTPDGGSIYLEVRKSSENGKVFLRALVRDSGIGIGASDIGRIFRPFEIGERGGVRNYQGVGIGLALAKRYVEYHGGEIWGGNNPGGGSTFEFYIPLGSSAEAAGDDIH
ncbi:hypothetical protein MNBD_DELTA02-239 [hydrothermal vent metagenome]|uniref:histidine kinase n=1 Tax=hydrothermal vent metagenome TaxID=652676 RepID=A0A3B0V0B3_9ZZZZ